MRVLVTGAGGFVGRALVRALAPAHHVVALDRDCTGVPAAEIIEGDIADPEVAARSVGPGCDAVVHLATLPGGATEQDPALGWHVNLAGSAALLDAISHSDSRPRFVFASSIAALGEDLPAVVTDSTPLRPRLLYGAHKAMVEQWVSALTRRGALDGMSLRLSGVVARPALPSGMKSAFLSELFHAALAQRRFVVPLSPDATTWLTSLQQVVRNLRHAVEGVARTPEPHAFTLPVVRVTMAELVDEVAAQAGCDPALIRYAPDPALEAGFGRFPELRADAAEALGFADDGSVAELVRTTIDQIREES